MGGGSGIIVCEVVRMVRRMDEDALLQRITVNPHIFGGKPIIHGRQLAVVHALVMLAAGDTPETMLEGYPWLEVDGIQIDTWRVIAEYFEPIGLEREHVYEDEIKNRQLFKGRRNKNPEGMKAEYLLVLRKRW